MDTSVPKNSYNVAPPVYPNSINNTPKEHPHTMAAPLSCVAPVLPAKVEIHFLTSYPTALPNRDDTGLSKVQLFGNTLRTRISSQAQKRRWRFAEDQYSIRNIADAPPSYRSREIIDIMVMAPLYEADLAPHEVLDAVGSVLNTNIYSLGGDDKEHRQAMMLGAPEVRYLAEHAARIVQENSDDVDAAVAATKLLFDEKNGEGANFKVFRYNTKLAAGIEAALWGRMVTSDTKANIDGAIAVAHAITVHEAEHEADYFTAFDDLHTITNEPGTAMLGHTELTSGLYYGYVVADLRKLVSNTEGIPATLWLNGERLMAAQVMHNLIQLIATVSTAAKLGSTAAFTHASFIMVEMSDRQPRQLAEAYRVPAKPTLEDATARLADYIVRQDRMVPRDVARRHTSILPLDINGSKQLDSVSDVAMWVYDAIVAGVAQ